ncbi:MAG: DUF1848 domain-containing protein [Ruminiclostridium sp.]|nr:DUF1848 domain-containing protein [Ruminiclostridium sp.]
MILSVSRRTDIPSYYSEWFFNRIKEGFVLVRNPMNHNQISRVSLSPDVIDCIVFWSKNPKPMIERLDELKDYHYYFQFTLNSYAQDIEAGLPQKAEIIDTFKRLCDVIGPERIIWRYDPILLNLKYTKNYHEENFEKIAQRLRGYTKKVTISFIDFYSKIANNVAVLEIKEMDTKEKLHIAERFSIIAKRYNLSIDTCAEDIDLSKFEIEHACCIDNRLIEKIIGYRLDVEKDKNQRSECGCVASVDIGVYNSCLNECLYCYANYSKATVLANSNKHNPNSPLLIGELNAEDKINDRIGKSNKIIQQSLFD